MKFVFRSTSRQFERAYPYSVGMPRSDAVVVILGLVIISQCFLTIGQSELEESSFRSETDYEGQLTYTDNYSYATLGPAGRNATLVMPGGHDYARPLPLVVSLHGYSGWGSQNSEYMGLYDSVYENEHLLLSPDGTVNWFWQRWWNATDACCNNFNSNVDDVSYLEGLIEETVQNYGADPEGVVVMGLSNGGFMSHRMACDSGNSIRAIVSLNGATWDNFGTECPDTGRPDILHVHSTADGVIQYDGGSFNSEYPSAMETVGHWANRSGCDSSMTHLGNIDLINSDGVGETDSYENLNCADGNRVAHWKINNGSHVPSLNHPEWAELTLSWALSSFVRDSDGDGYRDDVDVFEYDSDEWSDNDGDGIGDNADMDDDNDGLTDSEEASMGTDSLRSDTDTDGISDMDDCNPLDGTMYTDTDSDGMCDESDPDADDDGWINGDEFDCVTDWLDNLSVPSDFEGDGICDLIDTDDDNDDYLDDQDIFPEDPSEWSDNDGDGIGNNADIDDDDDGWSDLDEQSCVTDQWSSESLPDDLDGDSICDIIDEDVDGDGYSNELDQYPLDSSEWNDTDGDGIGDNLDVFSADRQEWIDTDADGVGDNSDVFLDNPNEWNDTDGDGVGDNTDLFPVNPSEWIDTDADGFGDNVDAFPMDVEEWIDTDADGVGDNSDAHPKDSSKWEEDPEYLMIGLAGALVAIIILTFIGRRNA